jgi:mannose/fructose/N-acetylgalactosamine-specific phosphotransferase system component IIC
MGDPTAFWLMAISVALAAAAITCLGTVMLAALFHMIDRERKRARMSGELVRYLRRTLEAERPSGRTSPLSSPNPDRASIPSLAV